MTSPQQPQEQPAGAPALSTTLLAALALLSAAGPLGTDMYLPTLVRMAEELHTTSSMTQFTLSAFMIGMAVGQLLIGPLSDSYGRRRLLIGGSVVFFLTSAAAVFANSIGLVIGLRFLMGAAGGTGSVLSRAIIPDLAHGRAAARGFSVMMAIQGFAPVLAPILGGLLAEPIGWRGIFAVLAGFNLLMVAAAVLMVPESLPAARRAPGGLRRLFPSIAMISRRRIYIGHALTMAVMFGVMFSYISASPFVLQRQLGLRSTMYSLAFAANAVMVTLASILNTRFIKHFSLRGIVRTGLTLGFVGSVGLVLNGLFGPWLWVTLPLLSVTVFGLGLVMGNATALGAAQVRDAAGAGSAMMGALQFLVAGVVSPLVGLGSNPALTMAVVMLVCAVLANAAHYLVARPTSE
ncbi:MFS transporter [Acidipropionibacterium acidipropionici]|uniref:multidrug effflux MFS transporter n=1 Tax=Acidipropionibacterium acidipropionici TaxID=1748 RepID=UPI0009EF51AC|nr:multidrug effflux MFS transporter [Acidipropionibacterium acidipropionici]AZP36547.1 MFS transporter [Acidipropionibacterium acidipropionici]